MARVNINKGPIIQFKIKEINKSFLLAKTLFNSSYFTFAKGGYIIKIKPMAMGILVEPLENLFIKPGVPGKIFPMSTPIAMAKNIHKLRYLSKKDK
jgi:hypothetical protein